MRRRRWIVDCSSDDCEAVLFADRQTCECRDESVCEHLAIPCGVPIVAVFPIDRGDINRVMGHRSRLNRNWTSETVAELKHENLSYGVKI